MHMHNRFTQWRAKQAHLQRAYLQTDSEMLPQTARVVRQIFFAAAEQCESRLGFFKPAIVPIAQDRFGGLNECTS